MGFSSFGTIADAVVNGQTNTYTWRKTVTQATTAAQWTDLSMVPGNPVPNYYASSPLVAATLNGNEGIFHGGPVNPDGKNKYLKTFMALTPTANAVPLNLRILDYLLYYPFVDQGTQDAQTMTNTVTLPRYTTGAGVMIMPVLVASQTGSQTFQISYTNQDGIAGRTTTLTACNTNTSTGTIVSSSGSTVNCFSPFVPLQVGDTGVRSIETFTMISGVDVGLITLVLVKPLATTVIRAIDAPAEKDFATMNAGMPEIVDGAFLNLIACPVTGSIAAAPIHGTIQTVWN